MSAAYDWRKEEKSLDEIIKEYPHLSKIFITKVDVQRRGVIFTEAAKKMINPDIHQLQSGAGDNVGMSISDDVLPVGFTLRDGTILMPGFDYSNNEKQRDPFVVDAIDGHIWITDEGKLYEEVEYWEKPDFFDKKTSNGDPMSKYITARPQRLDITLNEYCHFWDTPGEGCKYCPLSPNFKLLGKTEERAQLKYIVESVEEALKQKGRYSSVMFTGGSIISGKEPFDDEVDGYIELINAVGQFFKDGERFPSQLIATAFTEKQLTKLYENTGIMTYTADLEILEEEKFNWICAGKAKHIGYQEWKRRLYAAVDIFGRGNVNSGFVLGCELATPNGFKTEEEALPYILETVEELAEHGVGVSANTWRTAKGSIFANQITPSLEYFIKANDGIDKINRKYNLDRYIDDYRRCGMHPGNDLLRI